ncbi:UDP-N-acetylmuramoyl-L-alanyl-D-glutamate--2,6-diaminopimelate ligase [Aurantibacillus circumpalustris]|uniref:UDP-N-acetylmuramoyl-L-alanyl-D-glutamate--2, 6-diaminopimelate ligase n=1 Tax=Aurantibacillus circumpalustris TaxID=3036359 RepID=UPI00295C2EB0|nr:UDP-N-acetylmuramoyl-L-alanyl-D-glutamate--2,6-diaminopimelate ligase [Aurantibacillus circumpalustris]
MKLLSEILYKVRLEEVIGSTHMAISSVVSDSRRVKKGYLFVATNGVSVDGHQFIQKAIEAGAVAIVCEEIPENRIEGVSYVKVTDSTFSLGIIACNFYDNPSTKLKIVGVTGTNGKTTTVTLLFNLFKSLGYSVGLLSTVQNKINGTIIPSTHTTPDALALNELLRTMVEQGCEFVFMEVSSHAVVQNRIAGIVFAGGVFTNITHDHLDYHKTFDEYIKAKKGFFDMLPSDAFALVNKDDKNGLIMLQNTKAKRHTYALRNIADFKCRIIENHLAGLFLNIDNQEIWVKLIGTFNAYNVLAVYATSVLLKQDKTNILTALSNLNSVEGRFQYVKSPNGIIGIVDYAHTPDALKNVLETIKDIRTGNEQVITLVGCGGDRDSEKRPVMAAIACEYSNRVILTSDNPRSEDPELILDQMQKGVNPVDVKKTLRITDRKEAIRTACSLSNKGDIILIAGKGHEKYQEIKGVKHSFDDLEILKETIKNLGI